MGCWDRDADWNRNVLWHIVALLFSLAGLADRAADLRGARRREVLGILFWAEPEARAFIVGMALGAPILEDALIPAYEPEMDAAPNQAGMAESSCDAAVLAASFRALALALCVLLSQAWRFKRTGPAKPRPGLRTLSGTAGAQCRAALPAPDTS